MSSLVPDTTNGGSAADRDSNALAPVRPEERIPFIDILRGIALLGILIENMAVYAGYSYDLRSMSDPVGRVVALLVQFLLEAKSYSLLSLLFGWGVAVAARRAGARGARLIPLYLRRLLVLLALGLLHGTLIWFGDILVLYALLGMFLLPILFVRQRSSRKAIVSPSDGARFLLAAAGCAILFSIVLTLPGGAMDTVRAWYDNATGFLRYNAHSESLYRTGTYVDITRLRIQDFLGGNSWILYYMGKVFGMFLLGFYIGQRGLFARVDARALTVDRHSDGIARPSNDGIMNPSNDGAVRKTMWLSLAIGGPLNALYAATNLWPNLLPVRHSGLIRAGARTLGAPALVLFYICLVIVLVSKKPWSRRLSPAAYVGRMSLSNYLLQSIVCTLVFYGYGLGLYGQVGPTFGLIIAIVLYGSQVRVSEWWLDRYRFGPVEWLWRSLTYGRRQPWRILPRQDVPVRLRWTASAKIAGAVLVVALVAVAALGFGPARVWRIDRSVETRTNDVRQQADKSPRAPSEDGQQGATVGRPHVVATPQVEPVVYKPGPIAASGDLMALAAVFDVRAAMAQIGTLTGPPYLGRYPASAGGWAAGEYLAEQFAAYGLQPAGEDGTFYQSFPVEYVSLETVPRLVVELDGRTVYDRYVLHRDYNVVLSEYSGSGTAEGQVIWANQCAREDFDLLDTVDKVVLCREGATLQAQRNALEHGAAGLLLLADPDRRPPDFGGTHRESWVPDPIPTFRVYPSLVEDLLVGSGRTLADLSSSFTSFSLGTQVQMQVKVAGPESCVADRGPHVGCRGRNVLGVLPGRDPRYAEQVIILGAHYDHLGESPDATVWPGANDDASGVAVLLEIARTWHEQGYVPMRTVLFAAWDAEEMGLLGSSYYVEYPCYPLEATVAQVQLDMVGAGTDTLRVDGRGDLADSLGAVAEQLGIDVERTNLGRSDHVPFQAVGVPAGLLIWAQDQDIPPYYHRPLDVPAIIEPDKLEAIGRVAGISLLALAEGEPTIREMLDRRVKAVQSGDLDAFLATSTADRQGADRFWFDDWHAMGASDLDVQLDRVCVLGRTATAKVRLALQVPQRDQEVQERTTTGSMVVRFVHDGSSWKWAGSDLVWTHSDARERFSVALPPGAPALNSLARELEQRYQEINATLGLDGAGAKLMLYPDGEALRMDTALALPKGRDTWVGFRVGKATYTNNPTTTNTLDTMLWHLALAEAGVDEQIAPWLWHGLPLLAEERASGTTPAYLDDLRELNLSEEAAGQIGADMDPASAWAATRYLEMEIGWQGIGEFITLLGQACYHGSPRGVLQQGDPVQCRNPQALSEALSATLGIDEAAFENRWRRDWQDQLDITQATLDAVLTARTAAVLTGNEQAFLGTVDPEIPGLLAEEQHWFASLTTHPVADFVLTGTPLAVTKDGSLLADVTMNYRLQGASDRWSQATVPLIIRLTPAQGAYRWAGFPMEALSGDWVHILYPDTDADDHALAEALLPDIEALYLQLAHNLDIEQPDALIIKLYNSDAAFRTLISLGFPLANWIPAWTEGEGAIKTRALRENHRPELAVQVARHLLYQMGVESEWLLKGASLYLADTLDRGLGDRPVTGPLNKLLEASLDGTLVSLSDLPRDSQIDQETQYGIVRSQALDTINYLVDTHTQEKLFQLLKTHGRGLTLDAALQDTIGQTVSEFESEWAQSLARGHARPEWIEIARAFDPEAAYRHVEYLSGPSLAGRQAGSSGDEQAIDYIAAQLADFGLVPFQENGIPGTTRRDVALFAQRFPISYTTLLSTPSLLIHGKGGQASQTLGYRQDYVVIWDRSSRGANVSGELVWMRTDADSEGSREMDLTGKVVLERPSASVQSQASQAAQQGAAALLLIGNKSSRRTALGKEPLPASFSDDPSIPVLELTRQGTDRLMEFIGATPDGLAASPPALHMGYEVGINIPLDPPRTVQTANVLGLLPGTDPGLSEELIIIGAHHDHIGDEPGARTNATEYAGANDNASGVGVLLEIARLWHETGYRPRRSVLFAAWGAQEPGEIGARYFIEHPTHPLTNTVAVLELDGVGGGRGYFLEAQGDPGQEGLLRFTFQAAEEWVDGRLTLTRPSQRGDHTPFRDIGIPGLLLTWRESNEENLPTELADPVEVYRLGVTGKMTALALMALAR
jgi:uncharacterized protein